VTLSWLENAYSRPLFRRATLTGKVGQTGLVLMWDQGSVHARLQVSVYSGYDWCHYG